MLKIKTAVLSLYNSSSSLLFFILTIPLLLASCKGPKGPEGPTGTKGPEGPQGEQGPGAKVYNVNLANHIDSTAIGNFTTNGAGDTTGLKWGVRIDTTLTGMNITDTMFVQTYVQIPDRGYRQGPLEMVYRNNDGMLKLDSVGVESENYSQLKYDLGSELGSNNLEAPQQMSKENRAFYWSAPDNNGYIQFMVDNDTATARIRERNVTPSTKYESILYSVADHTSIPLDNDLSDPSANTYPFADINGSVRYMQQTTDLTALKDSLGSDLYHASIGFVYVYTSFLGNTKISKVMHGPNPTRVEIHVRSSWNSDSISVAGVVKGMNYGNDETVYMSKPVNIRIAVTGGEMAKKMESGQKVPFQEVLDAANK